MLLKLGLLPIFCCGIFAAPLTQPLLEANRGQFQSGILFASKTENVSTALTRNGLEFRHAGESLAVKFEGASFSRCRADSVRQSISNYLTLSPPVSAVPAYSSVICDRIYPGIDWVIHSEGGSLEHDWRLAPGADPARIKLRLPWNVRAEIRPDGALELRSKNNTILWRKPTASQKTKTALIQVEAAYRIDGRAISLQLGSYRRDLPLTIDPVIDFSYIINGDGDDRAYQVALDSSGDIYLAGQTIAPDFQTTPGVVSATAPQYPGSYYNVWVRKLSSDTSTLIYSTYVTLAAPAATVGQPPGHTVAMQVDAAGDVYIAANDSHLPAGGTVITTGGSVGLFKLSPDGSRFIYSAELLAGGGSGITGTVALAIDSFGNAYVAGGQTKAYVAKVDPTGTKQVFLFSTVINGGVADIAVGADSSVYVAGTTSQGFVATSGSLNPTITNPQNQHGFLFRIKPDGTALIFATWVGGQDMDSVSSMILDSSGNAILGGQTSSSAQYTGLQGTPLGIAPSPAASAFITKISATGNTAVFTDLVPAFNIGALATDTAGSVYASGPANQYTNNFEFTATAVTAIKIDSSGQNLLYNLAIATVNSVSGTADALAVDSTGAAYLAGSSGSIRVPEPAYVSGLPPNPFLVKIDPNPDQCDLELDAQPTGATFLQGSSVTLTFTIVNHGSAEAGNVVFISGQSDLQLGGQVNYCAATGSGICDLNSGIARVWFPSIPAGASEQVEFQINSYLSPVENVQMTASVYTSTSELNVANNTATSLSTPNGVPVYVSSALKGYSPAYNLGVPYTISGNATQPIGPFPGNDSFNFPSYAEPNSPVTVTWISPSVLTTGITGSVQFLQWSDGNTSNPRTFNIGSAGISVQGIFQLFTTPYLTSAGIVNAASYASSGVSPGEIVTLFGFNLGSVASAQVNNGVFSSTIGNSTLTFDGHPAPLIYTSGAQTAAVVPWEIAGQTSTLLNVQDGTNAFSLTIPVVPAVPALFTAGSTGINQAAALNQDGSINSSSNPANPGDVIVLYGTGEGLVSPIPQDGALAPFPASTPQLPITVTIGNLPAQVYYAGEAPALISGLIQINAVIPASIQQSDHVPVSWSAGTYSSQPGVTIAVK